VRVVMSSSMLALLCWAAGCSLITVQQSPFDPLHIEAKRPAPPPPPPKVKRVVVTDSNIQINDKVQFELGKAEIKPDSFGLLDEVAKVLQENPQIEQVEVQGHTDSTGDAKYNRKLSQQRAESVRDYLIKKGIKKGRLVAKGYGPDKPIADNATPEGQEKNRRVEFLILKQGQIKKEVEE
jgi:outer membrane protein OmpA-like peptidoglycan-associated protein